MSLWGEKKTASLWSPAPGRLSAIRIGTYGAAADAAFVADHAKALGLPARVRTLAADGLVDHLAGLLAQPGGVAVGARALGVGVGVPGQDLVVDGVLDEAEGPAGRVQSA
jgi:hypothetical protein